MRCFKIVSLISSLLGRCGVKIHGFPIAACPIIIPSKFSLSVSISSYNFIPPFQSILHALSAFFFSSYTKSQLLSAEYHCFTVLPWMVIILTYVLASMRNFICSFKSCSFIPVLVLILNGIFMIHESFFIVARVDVLSFNNALPHQVFITFLAGHHIFNSIHAKLYSDSFFISVSVLPYLFWISKKHFTNISSFAQKICTITGAWSLSVNKCLITHVGLIIYPSAFINSVRSHNVYLFFSPYISKTSFTIWRKAQSVNQSIGASQSIIVSTVMKLKKISSEKNNFLNWVIWRSIEYRWMKKLYQRVSIFNKDEGAIYEGFFGLVICKVKRFFLNLVVKKKRPAGKAIEK